jgi:hypothetical protein
MLPLLSRQLLTQWSDLPVDRRRPDQLGFLGIRTEVSDGYALFLAFADRDRAPRLAVKISREPGAESRLEREWTMLSHLQNQAPRVVRESLPRPVLWQLIGDVRVLVTTAPLGRPVTPGKDSSSEHFLRVGDWLVQLACTTRTTRPIAAIHPELERTTERLGTVFELSDQEMAMLDEWTGWLREMTRDDQVCLFAAHGDLRRKNVWLRRGHLTVINWGQSELDCPPLQDMFTFITTYRFPARRRRPKEDYLQVFRATYLADGPYADLAGRTITSYCRALGVPLESVEACFGIFLARAALREYDQLVAAADRGYLPLLKDPDCSGRQPYRQAIKNQLWINLLRLLIKERGRFKLSTYPGARGRFRAVPTGLGLSTGRQQALG